MNDLEKPEFVPNAGEYIARTKLESIEIKTLKNSSHKYAHIPLELEGVSRQVVGFMMDDDPRLPQLVRKAAERQPFLVRVRYKEHMDGRLMVHIDFLFNNEVTVYKNVGEVLPPENNENSDSKCYILNSDNIPVKTSEEIAWRWREQHNIRVGLDQIGEIIISTVFLTMDHNHYNNGPPVLWETRVHGMLDEDGNEDSYEYRYSSYEDAVEGHALAVKLITDNSRLAKKHVLQITSLDLEIKPKS